MPILFPWSEYWTFYVGFTFFVLCLLALDLGVFHRSAHAVSMKEATVWSVVWVAMSLCFNYLFYHYAYNKFSTNETLLALPGFDPGVQAKVMAMEFLTGYIVEKSLSIDNIFIFVVVFSFFAVPPKFQHRILFFGILGALVFRALFIALGALLMQYQAVVIIFGILLILTGIKILFAPDKPVDPAKNPLIKYLKRYFRVIENIEQGKFFLKINGVLYVTPLFLALVFIEVSDILFAFDSVPAIFAITKEPLIVYTSNIFAILGLRSLYFLLANVVDKFYLLKYGLGVVLIFVGLKMTYLNEAFHGKFPIAWSLAFISIVIGLSIVASLCYPKKPHAH